MKNWLKKFWRNIKQNIKKYREYIIAEIALLIAITFISSLSENPNLSSAIVAFGTLSLALATALSIKNSIEQEKRNRRERRLKEVIDWATDILICGRDISGELFKELTRGSISERAAGMEIEVRFNVISWRGVYIRHISSNLDKTLYDSVLDTQRILRQHGKIMELNFEGKIKNTCAIGKHRNTLDDSAKLIIEIAVSLMSGTG